MNQRIIAGLCAVALAISPLRGLDAQGLPDLGESAQAEISPAAERRVGESYMRDKRWRDPAYLDDAEVEDYLNLIGGKLVAASQEVRQNFDFLAVRDTTLNAFAWPGGFIGVHTGLFLLACARPERGAKGSLLRRRNNDVIVMISSTSMTLWGETLPLRGGSMVLSARR